MKDRIDVFKRTHDEYIRYATEKNCVVYYFRYEDLLNKKKETLNEIMRFMFGVESI